MTTRGLLQEWLVTVKNPLAGKFHRPIGIAIMCLDVLRFLNPQVTSYPSESLGSLYSAIQWAESLLKQDVKDNQMIGDLGAQHILETTQAPGGVCIMTHCNTGSLATAGYGTALGKRLPMGLPCSWGNCVGEGKDGFRH